MPQPYSRKTNDLINLYPAQDQKMSAEKRVALDINRYHNAPPRRVAEDTASVTVEATVREGSTITPNIIWWYDHLPENLSTEEEYFPSSLAALDVEHHINQTPKNSRRLIVLTSPAYKYPEGRLDIFFVTNVNGSIRFDAYGIPLLETPEETERRLVQFTPRSTIPNLPHLSNLDAIMTPLVAEISPGENVFHTASMWIDLPQEVWKQIASGEIRKRCIELTKLAEKCIAPAVLSGLLNKENPHVIGVRAENQMQQLAGVQVDYAGSGCGVSNSEFLESPANTHAVANRSASEYVFVRYCGACCGSINRLLSYGDRCPHCKQEFRPQIPQKTISPQNPRAEVSIGVGFLPLPLAFSWLLDWHNTIASTK